MASVMPMSIPRPEICDHPLIQSDDLFHYISDRMRRGSLDLYSAFLLAHEAIRIKRNGYLQPAWKYKLSISGLLAIYVHCITARAFREDRIARTVSTWLNEDAAHLREHRSHFLTNQLRVGGTWRFDQEALSALSQMRKQYDSLDDDNGPFHVEVFPWHYAAPERELMMPGSEAAFQCARSIDPEIEGLIVDLCIRQWA